MVDFKWQRGYKVAHLNVLMFGQRGLVLAAPMGAVTSGVFSVALWKPLWSTAEIPVARFGQNFRHSRIEHLARSRWLSRFDWTKRMAMCSAYFDESGHSELGPFVIVAGCVADVSQWEHFEREWLACLAPFNTRIFHAHEFDKGEPPFDKLSRSEGDDLFSRLVGIICRRVEKTYSQGIRLEQYRVINQKYIFAECYGYPYPAAARSCIGRVENWAEGHGISRTDLAVFFENGAKHRSQIEWLCERDKLQIPTFGEKSDYIPLQAADLIAWCHNSYLLKDGKVAARYESALDRLADVSNDWGIIDLEDPDKIPAILEIPLRNPDFNYKCTIVKRHGRRNAITHYWPKDKSEPGLDRKKLVIPELPPLTLEEILARTERYNASKKVR